MSRRSFELNRYQCTGGIAVKWSILGSESASLKAWRQLRCFEGLKPGRQRCRVQGYCALLLGSETIYRADWGYDTVVFSVHCNIHILSWHLRIIWGEQWSLLADEPRYIQRHYLLLTKCRLWPYAGWLLAASCCKYTVNTILIYHTWAEADDHPAGRDFIYTWQMSWAISDSILHLTVLAAVI